MSSVRLFVGLWFGLTTIIVAYAVIDLSVTPGLATESGLSLQPDLSQIHQLIHWGGRLLRENRVGFVANATILGGLGALAAQALIARFRQPEERRISIYPASSGPPSVG